MVKGFGFKTQKITIKERKKYKHFLDKVLEVTQQGLQKDQLVYSLLETNLENLNDEFAEVLRDWAVSSLPNLNTSNAKKKAKAICIFSYWLREFSQGDKNINLEIAIAGYQSALQIYTRTDDPLQWGNIHYNLGLFYRERDRGILVENLEQAIKHLKNSLKIFTYDSFPEQWARVNHNLGVTYCQRIYGDKSENVENAITYLENALLISTKQAYPDKWLTIKNDMAGAYASRIEGEEEQNIEKAISLCQEALQFCNINYFPEKWAALQNNLGAAYLKHLKHIDSEKAKNIESAISCFEKASQVYTQDNFLEYWAGLQKSLGEAYQARILGNRSENIEAAISYFEKALPVYTQEIFSEDWAAIQKSLGFVYYNREFGNRSENIEKSIYLLNQALQVYTQQTFPNEWGLVQIFLGETYLSRIKGEKAENLEQALTCCQNALQIYTLEVSCELWAAIQDCLGRAYSHRIHGDYKDNLEKSIISFERALQILTREELQRQIYQERQRHQSQNNRSETRAAFQAYNEAIATLETEKQQVWENLRREDRVLAGEIQVNPLSLSEIQNLIDQPNTAILSFYTTNTDTHIFVVQQDKITLHTCTGQGLETLQGWISQNWLLPYMQDSQKWQTQINSNLRELAERLQIPQLISQHLQGIEELILVPHLLLHQIPFAALPTGEYQEYLADKFLIRYTPSCQILEFCQQRDAVEKFNATSPEYGTVEDAEDNLLCARFEGEQIAQMYNISPENRLIGSSQATYKNYRQLAQQVNVLHSSHHAQSRLDNPLESQLKLADSCITLGQLMSPGWRLPQLVEVFLSCCETNLGTPSLTDDILTLSTGFLCAGARSVVSTLWAVDDLATAVFSIFYYQHRQQGKSRPEALQQAQIQLYKLKKEELLNRRDIQEFFSQVIERWKEAKTYKNLYLQDSDTYIKWEREYIKYTRLMNQIHNIKYSVDQFPFSHPRYWAAFICQGLR